MFILIGNFCSKPFGQHDDDRDTFVRNLDALGSMIASHPSLADLHLSHTVGALLCCCPAVGNLLTELRDLPCCRKGGCCTGGCSRLTYLRAWFRSLSVSLSSLSLSSWSLSCGRFVFVPGPGDPGACGVLPRPPVRGPVIGVVALR